MKLLEELIPGVFLLETPVHSDCRGFFKETYNSRKACASGIGVNFVQDNHSRSARGVLRGIHYQEPNAQGKLVQVINGAILDVVVDIREGSPYFGQWVSRELSEASGKSIWVPPGFAHGFLTLKGPTDVIYKVTNYWSAEAEHTIRWNDPELSIDWGVEYPILSDSDGKAPYLAEVQTLPKYLNYR